MSTLLQMAEDVSIEPGARTGEVVRASKDGLWVRATDDPGARPVRARATVGDPAVLQPGVEVLMLDGVDSTPYVIGVLDRPRADTTPRDALDLGHGSRAELRETPAGRTLQVFAGDGNLVFEYNAESGKARVTALAGALEVEAPVGELTIRAAQELTMQARNVSLHGSESVAIRAGRGNAGVTVDPRELCFGADRLRAAADRADFVVGNTSVEGNVLEGSFERVRFVMGKLETVAGTVVQKARTVFQRVEQLAQLKAGRVRTLVEGTHLCRARKVAMQAEKDVKINGDRIHLG